MRDWFATWPACTPMSTSTMPAMSPASVRPATSSITYPVSVMTMAVKTVRSLPFRSDRRPTNGAAAALAAPRRPNVPAAPVP